jgi:predicted transcriptional regulator of viral defense system
MNYEKFVTKYQNQELIRSQDFLKFKDSLSSVQVSRWVKSGKLIKLKRGVYILPKAYRKKTAESIYIANSLVWPSYISLEKALEHWGLIPEAVHVFTSITTKRPQTFETVIGVYSYRNINNKLFWGYTSITKANNIVHIAKPEKALLDLFYYHREKISYEYIEELRLQNLEILDLKLLRKFGERFAKKKIANACDVLIDFCEQDKKGTKML